MFSTFVDNFKDAPTFRKVQLFSLFGLAAFGVFVYFVPVSSLVFSTVAGPLVLGMALPFFVGNR